METLKIQPVEYQERRLNEVGERIIRVFSNAFDGYEIIGQLYLKDLDSILLQDLESDSPNKLCIIGPDFPQFLSSYGAPILGITSLPTTRGRSSDWIIYGECSKDVKNHPSEMGGMITLG